MCSRAQCGDVAGWGNVVWRGNVVRQGHSGLRAVAVVLQQVREGQCGVAGPQRVESRGCGTTVGERGSVWCPPW
jgi:hypothetical protein